jgi:hypothetical protein
VPLLFISHASEDRPIAEVLARRLEAASPEVKTFVASRPGDISADSYWQDSVLEQFRNTDKCVILLTEHSIDRPWVNFEAGAAWYSQKPSILVKAGRLPRERIHRPLSDRQVVSVDEPEGIRAVFRALDLPPPSAAELAGEISRLATGAEPAGAEVPAWEGLVHEGVFYAWAGPLIGLEDRSGEQYTPQLLKALEQRGLKPGWAVSIKLPRHFSKGRRQVFATDKKQWRRPVVFGNALLIVSRPEDPNG